MVPGINLGGVEPYALNKPLFECVNLRYTEGPCMGALLRKCAEVPIIYRTNLRISTNLLENSEVDPDTRISS